MFPDHIKELAKKYYRTGSLDDLDKLEEAIYKYRMENGIGTSTEELIEKVLHQV